MMSDPDESLFPIVMMIVIVAIAAIFAMVLEEVVL